MPNDNPIEPGKTQVVVCRLYPSQVLKLARLARRLSPNIPATHSSVLRWLVEHADEDAVKPPRGSSKPSQEPLVQDVIENNP